MRWQGESGRKSTGGKLNLCKGERKYESGREAADTTIGAVRVKTLESMGGNLKMRLLSGNVALVSDPKTGKTSKVKVETVTDNKANLHYTRRNIITKGAVIKTEIGDAKVTNRPGQDGIINAVLIPSAQ